jgi:hypothetical protein
VFETTMATRALVAVLPALVAPLAAASAASASAEFSMRLPASAVAAPAATTAAPGGHRGVVVRAPRRFDLVGLRWRSRGEPRMWMRVRRGGRWSRWVHVPHAHGVERASDPVWAGGAEALELRAARPVSGLRAHFVRVARPRARPAARAAAVPGQPPIVSRAAWGADRCPPRSTPNYGRVDVAFVHHTVSANDYRPEESAAMVLAICRYHRNVNGWDDVGYNFLVDRYGAIFEGRAGGIDRAVVGAQASGYNSISTGVSNLGEFTRDPQTSAGLDALARLLAWKLSLHGVPAEGQVFANGRAFQRISGHRDANATACPGSALYAQLPALRRAVAAGGGVATGLSLAGPARVRVPDAVALTGRLTDPAGAPLGGRAVAVDTRLAAGGWAQLGEVATAADGTWSFSVPTTRSATFRARFAGDVSSPPLESPARRVAVAPLVTAAATRSRVRRDAAFRLVGRSTPAQAVVEVLAWRRVRGTLRFAARFGSIERGARFASTLRLRRTGLYRLQARTRGERNAPGASNVAWVRVRR